MYKHIILFVLVLSFPLNAQLRDIQAPEKFDQLRPEISHGQVDTISYYSNTVGNMRSALVYTPPGFSKTKKYPVLYLLHGIGGDEFEWLNNGIPQVILDNLYTDGKIEPMLVVLPNGRAMKDDRATGNIFDSTKVKAFAVFEKDLLHDLIPHIEEKYLVHKDPDHRALAGLSMGGGQSLNFGLKHLGVFGWVGGFSSAPNTKSPEVLVANPVEIQQKLNLLWISCGDKDNLMYISKRTHDYLFKHQIPHIFYVEPGGHDFEVWKNDLYMFSQLIFKPVDKASLAKYSVLGVPASTNVRSSDYPRILPDHRVKFRIHAPAAKQVQVELGEKYDMEKDESGFWSVTTDSVSPGFHYYSLIIDGVALADPASETFYGMGRMASGIEIPFNQGEYYELRDVPHGEIRIRNYFSPVTRAWRRMFIYTPAGYDNNPDKKYPVLYLLHGGGEDQSGWANQGKADVILDNLIAGKQAVPMLVVMPDANMNISAFEENGLKMFESELKEVIIPLVEKEYRVESRSSHRALAGLSMGGIHTLYTGINNTGLFSSLGVFSSGWIYNMQETIVDKQYEFIRQHKQTINSDLKQLWIAMGSKEDIAFANCQKMLEEFDDIGLHYTYYEYPGGHTWPVWRDNLYRFAPLLFK